MGEEDNGACLVDFKRLADTWPSEWLARTEVESFTGGMMTEGYQANLDSQGKGPEGRFRIGRRIGYPVKNYIQWLEKRSAIIQEDAKGILNIPNENEEKDLIIGASKIEEVLGKSFLLLVRWQKRFPFPIVKYKGISAVSRKSLNMWILKVADGMPFQKITTNYLNEIEYNNKLKDMPYGRTIKGLEGISKFVHHRPETITLWVDYCSNSPITKSSKGLEVDVRSLLIFMSKMGIKKGNY